MRQERRQARRIAALLVVVTSLALLPALHVHLAGASAPASPTFASGATDAGHHAGLACPLCQAGTQSRFLTTEGRVASLAASARDSLRLSPADRPTAPGAPERVAAPPRAPPFPLS